MDVACVAHTNDVLGEVPRWHAGENALYWIDAFKPAVHRFDPASGQVESWTPPESYAFGEAELKPLRSGESLPWKLVTTRSE